MLSGLIMAPGALGGGDLSFLFSLSLDSSSTLLGNVDELSELNVLIATSTGPVLDLALALAPGFAEIDRHFLVPSGERAEVTIALSTSLLGNDDSAFGETLSNASFAIQAVHEPTSLALLGIGLLGLSAKRRRSRQA